MVGADRIGGGYQCHTSATVQQYGGFVVKIGARYVLKAVFYLIITSGLVASYKGIEAYIHPVIEDFTVRDYAVDGRKLVVSGSMNKVRYCEFIGVPVYGTQLGGIPNLIPLRFTDTGTATISRRTGYQSWGPWELMLPSPEWRGVIAFYAGHSCTPFWQTQTEMAVLEVYSCGDYVCIDDKTTKGDNNAKD